MSWLGCLVFVSRGSSPLPLGWVLHRAGLSVACLAITKGPSFPWSSIWVAQRAALAGSRRVKLRTDCLDSLPVDGHGPLLGSPLYVTSALCTVAPSPWPEGSDPSPFKHLAGTSANRNCINPSLEPQFSHSICFLGPALIGSLGFPSSPPAPFPPFLSPPFPGRSCCCHFLGGEGDSDADLRGAEALGI